MISVGLAKKVVGELELTFKTPKTPKRPKKAQKGISDGKKPL